MVLARPYPCARCPCTLLSETLSLPGPPERFELLSLSMIRTARRRAWADPCDLEVGLGALDGAQIAAVFVDG